MKSNWKSKNVSNMKNLVQFFLTVTGWVLFLVIWLNETMVSKEFFQPEKADRFSKVLRASTLAETNRISLDDILLTVKTTGDYHKKRVYLITKTWFKYAKNQTYFVTDKSDPAYQRLTGNHMIVSNCNTTHARVDLCCKTYSEYETFMSMNKKWWCHFDDDNYVNVDRLVDLLNNFDWRDQVYIGRRSVHVKFRRRWNKEKVHFRFGTGGAGICMTRRVTEMMIPYFGNEKFLKMCRDFDIADDTGLGFVINGLLGVNLTESDLLHSHLESLKTIPAENFTKQVTLSYKKGNVVNIRDRDSPFPKSEDPTRFFSLHCIIRPEDEMCPGKRKT